MWNRVKDMKRKKEKKNIKEEDREWEDIKKRREWVRVKIWEWKEIKEEEN